MVQGGVKLDLEIENVEGQRTLEFAFETSPRARLDAAAGAAEVPTESLLPPATALVETETAGLPPTSLPAAASDAAEVFPMRRGLPAAAVVTEFSSPRRTGAREARRGRAAFNEE